MDSFEAKQVYVHGVKTVRNTRTVQPYSSVRQCRSNETLLTKLA